MNIEEKIIKLLVASGNVSEEKVEQARKLAESLRFEGDELPPIVTVEECPVCRDDIFRCEDCQREYLKMKNK